MAVPETLVADQRSAQSALVTLANRNLLAVWQTIDPSDGIAARNALMGPVREIAAGYGEMSAAQAADFFDEARSAAGPPGMFRAAPASTAPVAQVDALVRWAVGPLFALDPDVALALSQLAGGVSRLVRQPGRETIWQATQSDPAEPRFARVPRAGACDWCLMLASRGGVYETEDTASTVQAGGRAGMSFHDFCGCDPMAVWTPDDLPQINRDLQDEWDTVTAGHADQLAAWREHIAATRGT